MLSNDSRSKIVECLDLLGVALATHGHEPPNSARGADKCLQ